VKKHAEQRSKRFANVENEMYMTVYTVKEMGLLLWKENVFSKVKTKITKALLDVIEKERIENISVNYTMMRTILESYG